MTSRDKFISKIVDFAIYRELDEKNKNHIMKAEKGDANSIIYVINGFIFGQNGFLKSTFAGIQFLQFGTEQNIASVIELYGNYLLKGDILPQDRDKAITLLNKAATIQQDPIKKISIVNILLSGQSFDVNSTANTDVNYFLAKQICKEAADLGNALAMREYANLCTMYQSNKHGEIKANFQEAYEYFTKASEKGDAESMYRLGNFYQFGFGGIKNDDQKALKLYQQSYEKGSLNGAAFYGYTKLIKKFGTINEREGYELIKNSCDQKSATGINTFGYIIDCGLAGLEKDEEKAFRYYKRAADLGQYSAINNVGIYYREGIVVQKDFDIAIKYFELALSRGSTNAANNLAKMYSDQRYAPVNDVSKAIFYFRLAIGYHSNGALSDFCWFLLKLGEEGDKNFDELKKCFEIGWNWRDFDTLRLQAALYLDGGDVYDKDQETGVNIFKQCADWGCMDSMESLIEIYEDGDDEIEADPEQAKFYKDMLEKAKNKT